MSRKMSLANVGIRPMKSKTKQTDNINDDIHIKLDSFLLRHFFFARRHFYIKWSLSMSQKEDVLLTISIFYNNMIWMNEVFVCDDERTEMEGGFYAGDLIKKMFLLTKYFGFLLLLATRSFRVILQRDLTIGRMERKTVRRDMRMPMKMRRK